MIFCCRAYLLFFLLYSLGVIVIADEDSDGLTEIHVVGEDDNTDEANEKQTLPEDTDSSKAFKKYVSLFSYHRNIQNQGMGAVFKKVKSNDERKKIIAGMTTKIFETSAEAKQNLTEWGFVPGDEFPVEQRVKESFSKILENTAMFSEFFLKYPEDVHEILDNNADWKGLLKWSYDFCLRSKVFKGMDLQKLDLMAKEANIIPKDANYQNLFREGPPPKKRFEDPKPTEKKKPNKIPRGPKLSHPEL